MELYETSFQGSYFDNINPGPVSFDNKTHGFKSWIQHHYPLIAMWILVVVLALVPILIISQLPVSIPNVLSDTVVIKRPDLVPVSKVHTVTNDLVYPSGTQGDWPSVSSTSSSSSLLNRETVSTDAWQQIQEYNTSMVSVVFHEAGSILLFSSRSVQVMTLDQNGLLTSVSNSIPLPGQVYMATSAPMLRVPNETLFVFFSYYDELVPTPRHVGILTASSSSPLNWTLMSTVISHPFYTDTRWRESLSNRNVSSRDESASDPAAFLGSFGDNVYVCVDNSGYGKRLSLYIRGCEYDPVYPGGNVFWYVLNTQNGTFALNYSLTHVISQIKDAKLQHPRMMDRGSFRPTSTSYTYGFGSSVYYSGKYLCVANPSGEDSVTLWSGQPASPGGYVQLYVLEGTAGITWVQKVDVSLQDIHYLYRYRAPPGHIRFGTSLYCDSTQLIVGAIKSNPLDYIWLIYSLSASPEKLTGSTDLVVKQSVSLRAMDPSLSLTNTLAPVPYNPVSCAQPILYDESRNGYFLVQNQILDADGRAGQVIITDYQFNKIQLITPQPTADLFTSYGSTLVVWPSRTYTTSYLMVQHPDLNRLFMYAKALPPTTTSANQLITALGTIIRGNLPFVYGFTPALPRALLSLDACLFISSLMVSNRRLYVTVSSDVDTLRLDTYRLWEPVVITTPIDINQGSNQGVSLGRLYSYLAYVTVITSGSGSIQYTCQTGPLNTSQYPDTTTTWTLASTNLSFAVGSMRPASTSVYYLRQLGQSLYIKLYAMPILSIGQKVQFFGMYPTTELNRCTLTIEAIEGDEFRVMMPEHFTLPDTQVVRQWTGQCITADDQLVNSWPKLSSIVPTIQQVGIRNLLYWLNVYDEFIVHTYSYLPGDQFVLSNIGGGLGVLNGVLITRKYFTNFEGGEIMNYFQAVPNVPNEQAVNGGTMTAASNKIRSVRLIAEQWCLITLYGNIAANSIGEPGISVRLYNIPTDSPFQALNGQTLTSMAAQGNVWVAPLQNRYISKFSLTESDVDLSMCLYEYVTRLDNADRNSTAIEVLIPE